MKKWGNIFLAILLASTSVFAQNKTHFSGLKFKEGETFVRPEVASQLDSIYRSIPDQCILQLSFNNPLESYLTNSEKQALYTKRAKNTEHYLETNLVEPNHAYLQYGSVPQLIVYKPIGELWASGKIDFSLLNQECASINGKVPDVIFTQRNTKIEFSPYSFESVTGELFDMNSIEVCVYEFRNKKELVYSQLTTHSNDDMLETAGSFLIEAKDINGIPLKLKRNRSFTITITDVENRDPNNFYTYQGHEEDGIVNWYKDETLRSVPTSVQETLYENEEEFSVLQSLDGDEEERIVDQLVMKVRNLGWINCDRFYDDKNNMEVVVRVLSKDKICVRMVFQNIASVLPGYEISNNKENYQFNNIPKGEKVMILAYQMKGHVTQLGYQELIVGEEFNSEIALTEMSIAQFQGTINDLLIE